MLSEVFDNQRSIKCNKSFVSAFFKWFFTLAIPFVFLFFSFLNFTETLFKVNERFYNKQQENLLFHDFRTEKDDCQVGDDQPKRGLRAVDKEPSFGARIDECQRPVVIVFH